MFYEHLKNEKLLNLNSTKMYQIDELKKWLSNVCEHYYRIKKEGNLLDNEIIQLNTYETVRLMIQEIETKPTNKT